MARPVARRTRDDGILRCPTSCRCPPRLRAGLHLAVRSGRENAAVILYGVGGIDRLLRRLHRAADWVRSASSASSSTLWPTGSSSSPWRSPWWPGTSCPCGSLVAIMARDVLVSAPSRCSTAGIGADPRQLHRQDGDRRSAVRADVAGVSETTFPLRRPRGRDRYGLHGPRSGPVLGGGACMYAREALGCGAAPDQGADMSDSRDAAPIQAVIMAGGEGSRLRPLTGNMPKPMLPVANRPLMEHILAPERTGSPTSSPRCSSCPRSSATTSGTAPTSASRCRTRPKRCRWEPPDRS